jgi:2,3-bisphosphoglycerate-dependent phosphoglycerate mutase
MSTIIYFLRHSEPTNRNNLKNISNHDNEQVTNEKSFLSVSGEKRAEKLSKLEELSNIDSVYSSNYVRALETAKYIALENNSVINVDDRLNERKIGALASMPMLEFEKLQMIDWSFKLPGGESLNQVKKRVVESVKNILMFETDNRVVVVSHATVLTCLLSAWCKVGRNYDNEIILEYNDETIIDGNWDAPALFKVEFDGMDVISVKYISLEDIW